VGGKELLLFEGEEAGLRGYSLSFSEERAHGRQNARALNPFSRKRQGEKGTQEKKGKSA